MIGEVKHIQGNYKEVVIAEKGELQVIDCRIGDNTLLLRVEPKDRQQNPMAHKITFDTITVQTILDNVISTENTEEHIPPEKPYNLQASIAAYTQIMEAGPRAENEAELEAIVTEAYSHGLYFDYDSSQSAYVLIAGSNQQPPPEDHPF